MTIDQAFFEMRDVRPLRGAPWIVLRQITDTAFEPPAPSIVRLEEHVGIATAAIEIAKRTSAEKLGWSELDVNSHRAGVERWGYRSTDIFRDWTEPLGINLVIDQHLEHERTNIWHLHPDLVVALRLLREGDVWFRPEEGWIDVVRLRRDSSGAPTVIEIRAEFLADYLAARNMALYCSSYRERIAISAMDPAYSWGGEVFSEEVERDQREAITTPADYPDPEDHFFTRGALWRTEWIEPGRISTRVRGDADSHAISFILKTDGSRQTPSELAHATGWLYFNPTLASALLRYRSGRLGWFTGETGSLGATRSGLHFGVNDLGLITVFAKDVGRLAAWEQRLWAAHNVTPEGGVSRELFAAQMQVSPASTVAPERDLAGTIEAIDQAFVARYGTKLLREHDSVPTLLRRAHRFVAAEPDGLFELAKEVTRLFIERVDIDAVMTAIALPKGDRKPGSLKILEKLVAVHRPETEAKKMMAPLFGIYDLRLADAHLGSSLVTSGMERAGVDGRLPAAMQGRQLLQSFIDTLRAITAVLV